MQDINEAVYVYNGIDYSAVYNYDYYINTYSDLKNAFVTDTFTAIAHFVNCGMSEGRQGCAEFNVQVYKNNYADLQNAYGENLASYYLHYISNGKAEGRVATDSSSVPDGATVYNGVDYSSVYNYDYYMSTYPDLSNAFGDDEVAALAHFANSGMSEGRQGCADFNVQAYKNNNMDLQNAFGDNLATYYLHYISCGKAEGRVATDNPSNPEGITVYNGVDYASVYNYCYYLSTYADLQNVFADDDESALEHFINRGMSEGRRGCAEFDVQVYKNNYIDLQNAFVDNLAAYYQHYITNGKNEGRTAI